MLVNGEKWACESCVRGHRVSNCNHHDRTLLHINKKGRPVSQCQHCRSLRRTKSAHHKCDCGEKVAKCPHLQASVEGHHDTCCCNHGAPCTCAHKKEQPQLDTVPESDSDQEASSTSSSKVSKHARKRRSRTNTHSADGVLCFDEHGHHKPTYKHVKPHQKVGPYPLTRGYSNQSASSSMEDLGDGASLSQANDQRMAKSGTASPMMTASSALPQPVTSLSLDIPATQDWMAACSFELFGEKDAPAMSAGLSCPSVDWTTYGPFLDYREGIDNMAPSSYGQAPSFFGEYGSTLPSGEASEVEDLALPTSGEFDPAGTFSRTNTASTGFSFQPSQEDMALGLDLGNVEMDFAKLKGLEGYDIDATGSLSAELSAPLIESSFQEGVYWSQSVQDGEPDLNESSNWAGV